MAGQSRVPADRVADGEVQTITPFQRLVKEMAYRARMESSDNAAFVSGVETILEAETEEEMWAADERENIGGRDLADVEQRVLSFIVRESNSASDIENNEFKNENGDGLYLEVTSALLSDGSEFIWNTSARFIVSKLWWLMKNDKLPAEVVIKGIKAKNGTVLKLRPVPKRAVSSTSVA